MERVVHEIACDPGCEVMLDGAVVGKAAPEVSYRVEFLKREGQFRTYVLRPIGNQHREMTYRAPTDRSVKTSIRLPCAPRIGREPWRDAALYEPNDSCRMR